MQIMYHNGLYDALIRKAWAKMLDNTEDYQEQFGGLKCMHNGSYADDYLVYRTNCSL